MLPRKQGAWQIGLLRGGLRDEGETEQKRAFLYLLAECLQAKGGRGQPATVISLLFIAELESVQQPKCTARFLLAALLDFFHRVGDTSG